MLGYFVLDDKDKEQKRIQEIYAKNLELFEVMIRTIVQEFGSINLVLPPWRIDYINSIIDICEQYDVSSCWNWLIRDWHAFIYLLMKAKSSYTYLPDGELNIEIKNYGTLNLTMMNNIATCCKSQETPDISLDTFSAARLLFGHGNPTYVTTLPQHKTATILAWFPLPLYCPQPDAV